MSASVDQRGKGSQPNAVNGTTKDGIKDGEFDYMQQGQAPQGAYNPMAGNASIADPYMNSYYGPMASAVPYYQSGVGDSAWSNGAADPMSFLNSYGGPMSGTDYMSGNGGMFGGFSAYSQPGVSWDFPGTDYTGAWGHTPPAALAPTGRKADAPPAAVGYTDSYGHYIPPGSHQDPYSMNGEAADMKAVESGMRAVEINDQKANDSVVKEVAPAAVTSSAGAKKSWASIASQPARAQPLTNKPKVLARPSAATPSGPKSGDQQIGAWSEGKGGSKQPMIANRGGGAGAPSGAWPGPRRGFESGTGAGPTPAAMTSPPAPSHPVLEKLKNTHQYNPKNFDSVPQKGSRYFIIKSYSEDDIHRSIKYSIWCSTEHGNKRLDAAWRERETKGPVYLLYSVNGSGHFCGMAQMVSPVDYGSSSNVWAQDKWKGKFQVKWIYVKDVPNSQLRHIRLENNENKPVTNSRDTQEVPPEKGRQVLKIIHQYRNTTSIFDDFTHYEKRQEEENTKDEPTAAARPAPKKERGSGDNRDSRGGGGSNSGVDSRRGDGARGGSMK